MHPKGETEAPRTKSKRNHPEDFEPTCSNHDGEDKDKGTRNETPRKHAVLTIS